MRHSNRTGIAARGLRAALLLLLAAAPARAEDEPELPESLYEQGKFFVIGQMRELARTVIELAPEPTATKEGRDYLIAGLPRLDAHFPGGVPITSDGKLRARLVRLAYRDADPAGLSPGDAIEYEIQVAAEGAVCVAGYRFLWRADGALAGSATGATCLPARDFAPSAGKLDRLMDALASDKAIVELLIVKEREL